MIIIDGKDTILGRLASFAAKKAMMGEEVMIINSAEVVVSGRKSNTLDSFKRDRKLGTHSTGPFHLRLPEDIVKRTIRGMLPYKQPKGREAFQRMKCYRTVPESLKGKEAISLEQAKYTKLPNLRYIKLGRISKLMGAKI